MPILPKKEDSEDSEDMDDVAARNKALLKKLEKVKEGDGDSDAEIEAALNRIKQDDGEEQVQERAVDELEKAEAVQTQLKVFNTVLQ
jgi:hypothetical protein